MSQSYQHVTGYRYQPALDGLRALAVAAVLAFHGGVGILSGGFLGVDAFFVLSGFLITSLLLTEWGRTGRIRLGAFWGRRARRLLPALFAMIFMAVLAFRSVLPAVEVKLMRGDALAALGYVANWRMIFRGSDYFAQTANPSPLQHTWSLGIEEQFYLLWPLLLLALLRLRRSRAAIVVVSLAGAAASTVLAALLYQPFDTSRAYYGTDTRASALLIGCALAALLAGDPAGNGHPEAGWHRRSWRFADASVAIAALVGVLVTAWLWSHASGAAGWLYHGGLAVAALAIAAVIADAVRRPGGLTASMLALPPLVWLGRISYGVYLWHWPLFQLVNGERTGLRGLELLLVRAGLTCIVAVVSFLVIEQPIRSGHWLPRRRPLTPAVTAGALAITVVAVVGATVPPGQPPALAATSATPVMPSGSPTATPSATALSPMKRADRRPGALPRVAFFGDSVSWTLGTYLPPHPGLDVSVPAIEGCGIARLPDILELGTPHTNYPGCTTWDTRWRKAVAAFDPDVSVILLDRWELMDRRLNGVYQHVGEPAYNAYLTGELDQAIAIASSRGAVVVLLTAPYTHRAERPDGGLYGEDQPARVDAWNQLLYAEAARQPDKVRIIDLNARVCPDGHFTWSINGLRIRSDGLHFTPAGVQQWIAPWLLPQLTRIATAG